MPSPKDPIKRQEWIDNVRKNSVKFWLGKKLPEGTGNKISIANKGKFIGTKNPFFGKHHTEEAKEKNRLAHLGHKKSEETLKKMSLAMRGKRLSEETKKKLSLARKGKPSWHKGRKRPNISKKHLGKKLSEETKIKLSIAHKGERSRFWKGGITLVNHGFRKVLMNSSPYKQWRNNIFERDDFTCQECSQKGGKLNADHINPFSVIIQENKIKTFKQALKCEELWDINNGRTLCVPCHLKTDTYGTRLNLKMF